MEPGLLPGRNMDDLYCKKFVFLIDQGIFASKNPINHRLGAQKVIHTTESLPAL